MQYENCSWALDVLACPRCMGRMRILAAIHHPDATRKILECVSLPSRAPPVAPAAFNQPTQPDGYATVSSTPGGMERRMWFLRHWSYMQRIWRLCFRMLPIAALRRRTDHDQFP